MIHDWHSRSEFTNLSGLAAQNGGRGEKGDDSVGGARARVSTCDVYDDAHASGAADSRDVATLL